LLIATLTQNYPGIGVSGCNPNPNSHHFGVREETQFYGRQFSPRKQKLFLKGRFSVVLIFFGLTIVLYISPKEYTKTKILSKLIGAAEANI
jgi:hypothetical protein